MQWITIRFTSMKSLVIFFSFWQAKRKSTTRARHSRKKQLRFQRIFPNCKFFLSSLLFPLISNNSYLNPLPRILEKWLLPPTLLKLPSPSTEWYMLSTLALASRMYMILEHAFPPCWLLPLARHQLHNEQVVLEERVLVNAFDCILKMLIRSCLYELYYSYYS